MNTVSTKSLAPAAALKMTAVPSTGDLARLAIAFCCVGLEALTDRSDEVKTLIAGIQDADLQSDFERAYKTGYFADPELANKFDDYTVALPNGEAFLEYYHSQKVGTREAFESMAALCTERPIENLEALIAWYETTEANEL